VNDPDKLAYGPVTLLAIRLKATNGLAQAARQRVRVKATRVLTSGLSNNPVTVIKDIWSNADYGLGRPLDELDPIIDNYETEWLSTGPYFHGTFDQRGTGFEGMQRVASLAAARVVQNGGYTTIVPDEKQSFRYALFTTANIIENTFSMNYTFDSEGEYDGIQVEYRDPETFDVAYSVYPRESVAPENFVLFGCTDATYAYQYATYLWNVKTKRRKVATINTELDGLIPRFGDRIGISHNMLDMGQSGVFVKQIDANTWMVDQDLNWERDNVIVLRDERGVPTEPVAVTQGAHPQHVVFSQVPLPIDPSDGYAREPTSYAFGRAYNVVRDFIVSKIAPKGDNIVQVEGQTYDDTIYDGAPPHMRS
jgi:predicted phage tail protein